MRMDAFSKPVLEKTLEAAWMMRVNFLSVAGRLFREFDLWVMTTIHV
jgi:hypothetical protein